VPYESKIVSCPSPHATNLSNSYSRYLSDHPEGAPARDVHDAAAEILKLSDIDRAEVLPGGRQRVYKNRAGWVHDRLKRAGFSRSLRRGHWQLTEQGHTFATSHPAPLSEYTMEKLASENLDVPLRPLDEPVEPAPASAPPESAKAGPTTAWSFLARSRRPYISV